MSTLNTPKLNYQPVWIDTAPELADLVELLSQQPLVAVDTESDSLYSYYEKVCLIQFSIPQADYLVDPLAIDVSALGDVFADPAIEKIFHAAEYDFLSMKRDFGFVFNNLFDTMLAARILGWPRYGLGPLLEEYFGIQPDKRFQRYNWGQRPLSKKALEYAHLDTHYLIPLREIQLQHLTDQNRQREAAGAFERLTQVEPTSKIFNPDDFWRIKYARDLRPQQQAVLRQLFILRDKLARRLDRPPFKVMNDRAMVELAKTQPQTVDELDQLDGLGKKLLYHNVDSILEAIRAGQAASTPTYPSQNQHRPDSHTMTRYETLRQWRNDVAAERGVEPDVIISNHLLMEIARSNPKSLVKLIQSEILDEWQQETYGKMLLNVLQAPL